MGPRTPNAANQGPRTKDQRPGEGWGTEAREQRLGIGILETGYQRPETREHWSENTDSGPGTGNWKVSSHPNDSRSRQYFTRSGQSAGGPFSDPAVSHLASLLGRNHLAATESPPPTESNALAAAAIIHLVPTWPTGRLHGWSKPSGEPSQACAAKAALSCASKHLHTTRESQQSWLAALLTERVDERCRTVRLYG